MFTLRIAILFVHVTAVIVALGGSLFSTFVVIPVIQRELEVDSRLRVARGVTRRLAAVVLISLAVLIVTGIGNLAILRQMSVLLAIKLLLVAVVIFLAIYQYGALATRFFRQSRNGPSPELPAIQARFRRVGLTIAILVLLIVYLSLGLLRAPLSFTFAPPP